MVDFQNIPSQFEQSNSNFFNSQQEFYQKFTQFTQQNQSTKTKDITEVMKEIEQVEQGQESNQESSEMHQILQKVLETNFDKDKISQLSEQQILKLFQYNQLSLQYLLQSQNQFQSIQANNQDQLMQQIENKKELENSVKKKELILKKLRQEYQENKEREKNLTFQADLRGSIFTCRFCQKLFESNFYLRAHLQKRHNYQLSSFSKTEQPKKKEKKREINLEQLQKSIDISIDSKLKQQTKKQQEQLRLLQNQLEQMKNQIYIQQQLQQYQQQDLQDMQDLDQTTDQQIQVNQFSNYLPMMQSILQKNQSNFQEMLLGVYQDQNQKTVQIASQLNQLKSSFNSQMLISQIKVLNEKNAESLKASYNSNQFNKTLEHQSIQTELFQEKQQPQQISISFKSNTVNQDNLTNVEATQEEESQALLAPKDQIIKNQIRGPTVSSSFQIVRSRRNIAQSGLQEYLDEEQEEKKSQQENNDLSDQQQNIFELQEYFLLRRK